MKRSSFLAKKRRLEYVLIYLFVNKQWHRYCRTRHHCGICTLGNPAAPIQVLRQTAQLPDRCQFPTGYLLSLWYMGYWRRAVHSTPCLPVWKHWIYRWPQRHCTCQICSFQETPLGYLAEIPISRQDDRKGNQQALIAGACQAELRYFWTW